MSSLSVHPSGKLALSVGTDKTLRWSPWIINSKLSFGQMRRGVEIWILIPSLVLRRTWNLVDGRAAFIKNIKLSKLHHIVSGISQGGLTCVFYLKWWVVFVGCYLWNTTFKVGPSSPAEALKANPRLTLLLEQALSAWRFASLCFSYFSAALLATNCPKVDAQKRPEQRKIRKCRQRAGSAKIQTPPHTSSGS